MATDCLFCSIVAGDVPATKLYEDAHAVAIADINPQAEVHTLVLSREHFTDVADIARDADAAAGLLAGIRGYTEQAGLAEFRTVFNTGAGVGQTVIHVHAHVLAGRHFDWPPG